MDKQGSAQFRHIPIDTFFGKLICLSYELLRKMIIRVILFLEFKVFNSFYIYLDRKRDGTFENSKYAGVSDPVGAQKFQFSV